VSSARRDGAAQRRIRPHAQQLPAWRTAGISLLISIGWASLKAGCPGSWKRRDSKPTAWCDAALCSAAQYARPLVRPPARLPPPQAAPATRSTQPPSRPAWTGTSRAAPRPAAAPSAAPGSGFLLQTSASGGSTGRPAGRSPAAPFSSRCAHEGHADLGSGQQGLHAAPLSAAAACMGQSARPRAHAARNAI
jgi:hypothetical protein